MKITRIIKYLGALYICVSGSYQNPIFWKIEKNEISQLEQRDWEKVTHTNRRIELKPGDLQPKNKEKVMSLVAIIVDIKKSIDTPKKQLKEKCIRSFPPKRKIFV